jgi:hypothetical protein
VQGRTRGQALVEGVSAGRVLRNGARVLRDLAEFSQGFLQSGSVCCVLSSGFIC